MKSNRKPDITVEDVRQLYPDDVFACIKDLAERSVKKLEHGDAASDIFKVAVEEMQAIADEMLATRKPVAEQVIADYRQLRKTANEILDLPLEEEESLERLVSKVSSYEHARLPCDTLASVFPTNLEAVLFVLKPDSKIFQEGLSELDKMQRDLLHSRLEAPGPGRPKETVEEFLNKVANATSQLGPKPRQAAVARLLGCDPSYLRGRRKKLGFKNWGEVLSRIQS